MKRLICLFVCFLLVILPACGGEQSATEPVQTQPTEPVQPLPKKDDLLYFRNPLEFDHMYAYDPATGAATLVLPQYVYDVSCLDDTVYFTSNGVLHAMDVTDHSVRQIAKDVNTFCVVQSGVVYAVHNEDLYHSSCYYYNAAEDSTTLLTDKAESSIAAGNDCVYFLEYKAENAYDLYRYSFEAKSKSLICADLYGYRLFAGPSGVYMHCFDIYDSRHIYVDASTGKVQQMESLDGDSINPLFITDDAFCYRDMYHTEDGWIHEIRCLRSDGTDSLLLSTEHGAYTVGKSEDKLLLAATKPASWGPLDAWGYRENYAIQVDFYLLDASGKIEQIEIKGESSRLFPNGDFPLIDSSTARKPVTAALYSLFVVGYNYEGQEPICSTTHGAWLNIADRKADLAFLAAPTEEEKAYLAEKNVEVEMKLYGGDGLVFIANAGNPVVDLTHEQILGIYTGKITNWKEVGGPDHPITVCYRDPQSGSQRLFESIVFKGVEKPDYEALGFAIEEEMSSIVNMVAYDPWAVGYSIMTYLDSVYENEEVKILTVDGVAPSPQTVADSSYRYHTKGYIVIRADEPANSPARRLFDWFGCPLSDALLESCSVTPLSA